VSAPLEGAGDFLAMPAWSAAGQPHAVVEGGDGATLLPLQGLQVTPSGDPGSWTRTAFDEVGDLTVTAAWLQGDEVRVLGTLRHGSGEVANVGVFRLLDGRAEPVGLSMGAVLPDDASAVDVEHLDGPVVWVSGRDGRAWRSADGGTAWESFPTR
jgi:hypothetical protein